MKTLLKPFLLIVFILGMAVVAYAIHEVIPSETQIPMPGPNADKLNDYIIKYEPYRAWRLWPGKGRLYEGTEPHGVLLTTFVNDTARRSIRKMEGMRDGSIIVNENYTEDKEFVALTVMYKVEGYNPGAGDWFWVRYAPDGKAEAAGKVEGCINCHGKVKDNDYIWTGKVIK
jgi:hypothetical protein